MSKQSEVRSKLRVTSSEGMHYIEVPAAEALALQGHLLRNGVRAAPPERCYSQVDTIELGSGVDTDAIQRLLDRWP
jgi:hypothetical protein